MATQIKITQLTDIGSNIVSNTVLPVVNLAGTAITQKTNVGNLGNAILANAGTTLKPAFLANLAYSVVNAAQPNITSVGTLSINTLNISGGENGQYLQTDGAGHLSWVTGTGSGNGTVGGANGQLQFNLNGNFSGDPELTWDAGNNQLNTVNFAASSATIYGNLNVINVSATGNLRPNAIYTDHYYYANGYVFGGGGGNGTPGGADTQIQFNDNGAFGGNSGFTFDKTTGIFTSPFLAGNGNGLSNIQGANVSGAVGLATYAGTANAVAGANVSGAVTYAGTANSVAVANVVGIGNIATVALSGNPNQVLYGNGVFDSVGSPFNQDLNTTDNVTFANITSTDAIRFSNSGNIVGAMGYAPNYVSIESYGSNTVNITANDIYTWSFDSNGNLSVPININFNGGGIQQVANEDFYVRVSDAENDGWSLYNVVDDGAGNALSRTTLSSDTFRITTDITGASYDWSFQNGQFVLPGNIQGIYGGNTSFYAYDNGSGGTVEMKTISYIGDTLLANVTISHPNVTISTQNAAHTWTFDGDGNLQVPGNIISTVSTGLTLGSNYDVFIVADRTDNNRTWKFDGSAGELILPNNGIIDPSDNNFEVRGIQNVNFEANATFNIYTDTSNNGWQWQFGDDGNLTLPGEGIIQSLNDTVILQSVDANSNVYSARLGTNGGLYFETTQYPQGWLSLTNNSGNANITAATGTAGGAGKHIIINAGDADQSDFYTSAGGNINIKGGLGAFNDGGGGGPGGSINITAGNSSDPAGVSGNINITSGPNVWSFNNVGQLVAIGDVGNSVPNLVIGGGSEPFISSDLTGGPGNLGLISNYLNLSGYTGAKVSIYADDGEIAADNNFVLKSNNTGTTSSWTFDTIGQITLPGNQGYIGPSVAGNPDLRIYNDQSAGFVRLGWQPGAVLTPGANVASNVTLDSTGFTVTTTSDSFSTTNDWVFGTNGNLSAPGYLNFSNGSRALMTYGANNYINLNNDGGIDVSCNTEVKITTNYGDAPNRAYSYFYANGTFSAAGNITTTGNITATNIGNVAALDLDGNASNVLYGNGVFAAVASGSSSNISNGNSNVNIASANGNVTIAAVGNSVVTITGTGANITGTANISGNANVGNLGVAAVVATANISTTGYFISGNQATGGFQLGNSNSRLKSGDGNSYMTMGQSPAIYPDTAASALSGVVFGGYGYLLGNNGSRCITLNYGGSSGVVGLQANVQVGSAGSGTVLVPGTVTTGVNSVLAGPSFTPLANTMAGFVSNVNYYTQLTIQNKNTGTDATTDFVATADNGSDTVNYLDMGIINSGYDNGTPTNSLGNIVFAADSYMYAQGNTSNASQSGGNLAIGTTVPGKNVKIFAGGVDNTAIVANIANTGVTITGNLSVSGNISGNTNGYSIGYLNIPQVSASNTTLALTDAGKHYYSTTAGNLTLTIPLNASVAFPTGTAISIVVQAAGNILVNAASGVTLYMAGNSTSANRVVGTYGMATLMKVASDTWFINGTGVS